MIYLSVMVTAQLVKQKKDKNMCKFMHSLSRSPEIIGAPQPNKNLEMFLKPCKEGEFYRVRLLAFNSKDGKRIDPHVTRMVHSSWTTDPNTGKKRLVKLVCSSRTPWVEVDGNKKTACKVCSYTAQQWAIYNESGKTDKTASAAASKLKPNFEAIVPVYVVNDPNYDKNNGKCKVITFDDKDKYMAFRKQIEAQSRINNVFNGDAGVDCLIYVGTEPIARANGTTFNKTTITKIKFSTTPKERPAITGKLIDSFPFDDTYFTSPSEEDIDEFYSKFCAISNDDVPEDDDIPVYKPAIKQAPKIEIPTNSTPKQAEASVNDVDELLDDTDDDLAKDPDEDGLDVPDETPASKPASNDVDGDDILAELGIV